MEEFFKQPVLEKLYDSLSVDFEEKLLYDKKESKKQHFENSILKDYYVKYNIKSSIIDMKEKPIFKIDVGSCDRWKLLYNMLKGSYTENNTAYGNFENDRYEFIPNLFIKYELTTDTEKFEIEHK